MARKAAQFADQAALIAAYDERWEEMVPGGHEETIANVRALKERGTPLFCLTNFASEKFALMRRRFDVFALFGLQMGEVHVLRNASIPIITQLMASLPGLLLATHDDDIPSNRIAVCVGDKCPDGR